MKKVSKITCENGGGFVQKFRVKWDGGESEWSGKYPNPQSRSFNLKELHLAPKQEVWIEVDVVLGKKKSAPEHVEFDPDTDDGALYKTTGATLTYDIKLMN